MATEYVFWLNGVTTNKQLGDLLGLILDPDPNATGVFVTKLRLIGSSDANPIAWLTALSLKAYAHAAIVEFDGPGPYTTLNALGITDQQVASGKAAITLDYGERSQYEGNAMAFIASLGYEVIPNV